MEDEGLCNPPDPKKQKLEEEETEDEDFEYEREEEDNRKLSSIDDLKEIREKIQNHISYWKALPYQKRMEDPWNFNYLELQRILDDYYDHNSLATSNTREIQVEFNLFKKVLAELVKDIQAFNNYLNETYDREWTLNLGKLYKLGMDNVVNKMREDLSVRKLDRYYLLEFIVHDLIPTWEKMDLGDTKDDNYEDVAKMLDKQWEGMRCSRKFFADVSKLTQIGMAIVQCMGRILKKRGVHKETKLSTICASTAANTHVDCLT